MKSESEKKGRVYLDHKGNEIPEKYVAPYDKRKDVVLKKLLRNAESLNKKLVKFKGDLQEELDALYRQMLIEYHSEPSELNESKSFYSFDRSIKIEMSVDDVTSFSDKINVAQQKLKEFIETKSAGTDGDLMLLVNQAFTTTKGRLDKARIFGLFKLNIKHPKWEEAMQLIKDSIETNSTRKYFNVYKRDGNGDYKRVSLNITAL